MSSRFVPFDGREAGRFPERANYTKTAPKPDVFFAGSGVDESGIIRYNKDDSFLRLTGGANRPGGIDRVKQRATANAGKPTVWAYDSFGRRMPF